MFQKLFKYEALAVGRVMVPVWLGALVLAVLSGGAMQLQNLPPFSGTPFLVILWTVVAPLSVLSLLAVIAVCIAANIQRFYTLLGVRGYLYFCLPVNPWQQLAAKWAVAMVSSAVSVPVLLLCGWLMGGDWRLTLFAGDHALIRIEDLDLTWQGVGSTAYTILLAALAVSFVYLYFYLCIGIGAHWPQHRLAASVIVYFVLSFILQVLLLLGLVVLGVYLYNMLDYEYTAFALVTDAQRTKWTIRNTLLIASPGLLLAAANGILWAVNLRLIGKKLNLA